MWAFEPRKELSVEEIFGRLLAEKEAIDGITVLGGEPLDQYGETLKLTEMCRVAGLGVMVSTGYEMGEILERGWDGILSATDILITGRYDAARRTLFRQWIGSENQEIHYLTDRYRSCQCQNANYVEISFGESGQLTVLGFPDESLWNMLAQSCGYDVHATESLH
jgi:anaerobic ribonucleoside-triphosphate reductase activating protein